MLVALVIILMVLMLAVGGDRGAKSFLTLVMNVILLVGCLYLIVLGVNALLATAVCSLLFIGVTLIYQNGREAKTVASVVAVLIVLCVVVPLAALVGSGGKAAGYSELDMREDAAMYLSVNLRLNMRDLFLSVIVFGVLGAAMDAAISVATSVAEFHANNPAMDFRSLARAGNAVGRDILGTTVNTVFFAGIGETIMQSILFIKNGYTFETLMNSKAFLQEFAVILFSNLACLFVIPLASALTSRMVINDRGGIRK